MSHSTVPAAPAELGWYRDPEDARRFRYWTGSEWLVQQDALMFLREGLVIRSPRLQATSAAE